SSRRAHHLPHHRASLEPIGQPHKVDEKELKKDHHELVAHPGPKKHDKKIPDAGETCAAYTVFENDNVKGNAQLAECQWVLVRRRASCKCWGRLPLRRNERRKRAERAGNRSKSPGRMLVMGSERSKINHYSQI
ncbi:hypothetical protein PENTCL1PPCAC_1299, partial [Pristionchus entomophagus]